MHQPPPLTSNFAHLQEHDEQLLRLGMLAERYFPDDPNTTLLKLRQLTELLAQREAGTAFVAAANTAAAAVHLDAARRAG